MRIKYLVPPVFFGGVLALDNFAIVPQAETYQDVFIKETTAASPVVDYCLPAGIYPLRYQRNSTQILRSIALWNGNTDNVRLANEIMKFPSSFGVEMSLYDGFFSWRHDDSGDNTSDPRYGSARWLEGDGVFHDNEVYPIAWRGLAHFPYKSHTSAVDVRFLYLNGSWPHSNLRHCLTAMHYLHAHEDINMARGLLGRAGFQAGSGVSRTSYVSTNWGYRTEAHMGFANCAFLAASCMLHRYAEFQGDDTIKAQAKVWADDAAQILVWSRPVKWCKSASSC